MTDDAKELLTKIGWVQAAAAALAGLQDCSTAALQQCTAQLEALLVPRRPFAPPVCDTVLSMAAIC
jgi:hypothetical protein